MAQHILTVLFLFSLFLCISSLHIRRKRGAYNLPAGAQEIVGREIQQTFNCPGDGYFADVDNDCKLFHRCHTHNKAGGQTELLHETFVCGNKTVWDQSSFACRHEDDAIPCEASPMFFDLNERIGQDVPFLDESDIERARVARPDFA